MHADDPYVVMGKPLFLFILLSFFDDAKRFFFLIVFREGGIVGKFF
jgi:hypothetical protein